MTPASVYITITICVNCYAKVIRQIYGTNMYNILKYIYFYKGTDQSCKNGDVTIEDDGAPLLFWNDKWSPICGHFFWDNQYGAELFCQKLGYTSGTQSGRGSNQKYSKDAIKMGMCNNGDVLEKCTGGGNDYKVGDPGAGCTAGNAVKITISCNGVSKKTASCKSKPGKNNNI